MQVDDELVIRPARELRFVRVMPSERAVVIGAVSVIFLLLVVILIVTW